MTRLFSITTTTFLFTSSLFAQGIDCGMAEAVTPGTHTAIGPSTGAGASQADAVNADWYAFTPTSDGYITVLSCGAQVNTRVHAHSGACGSLTLIASDDDGCPDGAITGASFLANIPVLPGITYYIEWDDRWSASGFDWQLLFHGCPISVPTFTSTTSSITVDWLVWATGAGFTIEYGPPGFTPGTGTVISGVQTNGDPPPVIIPGLGMESTYDIYISIDCGGGSIAPFNGPWHASTSGPLINDNCEGALPITCGSITQGNTTGAMADTQPACGTTITSPGIWYTFTGVSGPVILSTCADHGYDTKLNVYTGPCDGVVCVGGNDDGPYGCYPGSETIITADASLTYYVLVQGFNGAVGSFGLSMNCPTCAPPQGIFLTPADTMALVYWTSANPGATYTVEYGPVGFSPGTGITSTGIVGTDGPPVTITGLAAGTGYDVYVTEDCGGGDLSPQRGPQGFTTLPQPLPSNAFCSEAAVIACGQNLNGHTTQSIYSPGPTCGSANITAPGVWYTFTGDASEVTLSTCNQASYDTKISVFTGPCAALNCVAGDDDGPGCAVTSSVTFNTIAGVQYLALVHGYQADTGSFTLSMTCGAPCAPAVINDNCVTAQTIAPQPIGACVPLQSTNVCAATSTLPNPPCDPFAPINDVWFAFNTGPSPDHTLSVQAVSAGALNVAIYAACDLQYIVCQSTDSAVVLTGLDTNTLYFVRVWNGGGAAAGTFTICDVAPIIAGVDYRSLGNGLRVWPVPASDAISVAGLPVGTRMLRLCDAQGRIVLSQAATAGTVQRLNLGGLAPGAYVLRAEGEELRVVRLAIE